MAYQHFMQGSTHYDAGNRRFEAQEFWSDSGFWHASFASTSGMGGSSPASPTFGSLGSRHKAALHAKVHSFIWAQDAFTADSGTREARAVGTVTWAKESQPKPQHAAPPMRFNQSRVTNRISGEVQFIALQRMDDQ